MKLVLRTIGGKEITIYFGCSERSLVAWATLVEGEGFQHRAFPSPRFQIVS